MKKRYGLIYIDKDDNGNGDYSRYQKIRFIGIRKLLKDKWRNFIKIFREY